MAICDICGKNLSKNEAKIIPPRLVVEATNHGYVPTKLPQNWYSECKALGISVGSHWKTVVDLNSSVDWGLCARCLTEVESYKGENQEPIERVRAGKRFCSRFSKEIEIVSQGSEYVCADSLPITSNPNPCAEPFCIHNIMMATTAKVALKANNISTDSLSQAELQHKLLDFGFKDFAREKSSSVTKEGSSNSACFIATACYGSIDHPKVIALRSFRDNNLKRYKLGRAFIGVYYCISPWIVSRLKEDSTFTKFLRVSILDKLVEAIQRNQK